MTTARFPTVPRPRFYLGMAALMSLIVFVGFWPTYFSQVLHGIPDRPLVIHIHGLVFVGWMVLLVTQVVLAATGRTQMHRSLGSIGIAYGFLVLAMGLVVSIAAPVLHFKAGEQPLDQAAGFLIIPLGDMILFAGFFIPAVISSRISLPLAVVVWLTPVFAGMAYDKWTRRKVHPLYYAGLVILLIGFARIALIQSEAWLRIGRGIIRVFA